MKRLKANKQNLIKIMKIINVCKFKRNWQKKRKNPEVPGEDALQKKAKRRQNVKERNAELDDCDTKKIYLGNAFKASPAYSVICNPNNPHTHTIP